MYLHPPPADFNKEILNDGALAELPLGLDPARHRIIATHFYNWRPIGGVADDDGGDLRSRCQAKRQYAEGLG